MLDKPLKMLYKHGVPANRIEPFYKQIGRRIQTLRNELGMTQEDLGSKLDPRVTRASVANIEAGKQRILAHTIPQLAQALRVQLQTLFPNQNEKPLVPVDRVEAELTQKLGLSGRKLKKLSAKIKAARLEKGL
jgi:transcriptional regulator with XRE-family HTH domain